MQQTWGSTAHGSGRTMSRAKAKREVRGDELQKSMEKKGIYVRSVSMSGLAEEAGLAYKDVDEVIETVHQAGISKKVVKLVPIANIKG
jgi:tRNA-splicing ligase RtcB